MYEYTDGNRMIYLGMILAIFTGELYIKHRVEKQKKWETQEMQPILCKKIRLRRFHNRGACLNVGQKHPRAVAMVSLLFAGIMTVVFVMTLTKKGNRCLKTGLALLLGGAYSNTYDRLTKKYVVDYFSFVTPSTYFNRIVFNLSDLCIALGAMMTTVKML
ncbi:MAG: signal peptidase II [Lachnospiraceae bacterium]